jgi:hypothetical protein
LGTVGLQGCTDLQRETAMEQMIDTVLEKTAKKPKPPPIDPGQQGQPPQLPPPVSPCGGAGYPCTSPPQPTPGPQATIDGLVGTWVNADANTSGMTKLFVAKVNQQQASFRGYGKCSPTDCDWGAIPAAFSQPWTVGVYNFGFKQTRISISRAGDFLQIQTYDHYTDNSGRQDRSDQYMFKQTVLSTPPPVIIGTTPVIPQPTIRDHRLLPQAETPIKPLIRDHRSLLLK